MEQCPNIQKSGDADDLVEAIFSFFPPNDPSYTTNKERIHRAFYELKAERPSIFEDFSFDLDKPFPFCEDIDFAMQLLSAGSFLRKENLYLERLAISEKLKEYYDSTIKPRVRVEDTVLQGISKELQNRLRIT
jgi:hypothetical protein